jgi:predicted nucleotidyltransferase
MKPHIDLRSKDLADLCGQYAVARLHLFGSAATGSFRVDSSDLDFVVRFMERTPTGSYTDRFLDFADALERLFGRPVHLIAEESISNPFLRREIENTRLQVYEGSSQETAV